MLQCLFSGWITKPAELDKPSPEDWVDTTAILVQMVPLYVMMMNFCFRAFANGVLASLWEGVMKGVKYDSNIRWLVNPVLEELY